MADIESAIKGLKYLHDRDSWIEGIMSYDDHARVRKQICSDALELLKEQPQWIPAEERLPKSMINKVIVYVQHKDLASRIGFGHFEKFHGVGTWWDLERDEPFIKHGFTVTHWMPMPKSPEGETLVLC